MQPDGSAFEAERLSELVGRVGLPSVQEVRAGRCADFRAGTPAHTASSVSRYPPMRSMQ